MLPMALAEKYGCLATSTGGRKTVQKAKKARVAFAPFVKSAPLYGSMLETAFFNPLVRKGRTH